MDGYSDSGAGSFRSPKSFLKSRQLAEGRSRSSHLRPSNFRGGAAEAKEDSLGAPQITGA